jgi:hypothetical protein
VQQLELFPEFQPKPSSAKSPQLTMSSEALHSWKRRILEQLQSLFAISRRSVPKGDTHSHIQGISPVQFDVVANVAVTIVAHPPLLTSAVRFSYIQQ